MCWSCSAFTKKRCCHSQHTCTVPYCTALACTAPHRHSVVPYHTTPRSMVPHWYSMVLYCTVLHHIVLHCTAPAQHGTIPYHAALYCAVSHRTVPHRPGKAAQARAQRVGLLPPGAAKPATSRQVAAAYVVVCCYHSCAPAPPRMLRLQLPQKGRLQTRRRRRPTCTILLFTSFLHLVHLLEQPVAIQHTSAHASTKIHDFFFYADPFHHRQHLFRRLAGASNPLPPLHSSLSLVQFANLERSLCSSLCRHHIEPSSPLVPQLPSSASHWQLPPSEQGVKHLPVCDGGGKADTT